MEFIRGKVGDTLDIDKELGKCTEATVAVAYFNPPNSTMKVLQGIPSLKLIYLREYTITNPYKLEGLTSNGAQVRYAPSALCGKLHAKVYCGVRKEGSRFALIGSANLTNEGLSSNEEAGILFDSKQSNGDLTTIEEASEWFADLWDKCEGNEFDDKEYKIAKKQHEDARKRWEHNTKGRFNKNKDDINYWLLKTTEGGTGKPSHWNEFIGEQEIVIGWKDGMSAHGDKMIRIFKDEMKVDDIVVICDGYALLKYDTKKRVYGIARVKGVARKQPKKYPNHREVWEYRREAPIQDFYDLIVPKSFLKKQLVKGSQELTLNPLTRKQFESLTEGLHDEYGIIVDV